MIPRQQAHDFLKKMLANGPVPQKEIEAEAIQRGISKRTLKRAKKDLGIESNRAGFGRGSYSVWSLPHTEPLPENHTFSCREPTHVYFETILEQNPDGLWFPPLLEKAKQAGWRSKNPNNVGYAVLMKMIREKRVRQTFDGYKLREPPRELSEEDFTFD
ncbi:MAG: hypothetical protein GXY83_34200 [Rhodopirellula sp.]|nr:hypothetical protein [Rhodopirellula sp.]